VQGVDGKKLKTPLDDHRCACAILLDEAVEAR